VNTAGVDVAPEGNVQVIVIDVTAAVGAIAVAGTLISVENDPSAPAVVVPDPRFTGVPPRSATAVQVTLVPGTVTQPVMVTELSASTVGPPGAPPLGVRDSDVAAPRAGVAGPPVIEPNSGVVPGLDVCACAGKMTLEIIGFFHAAGASTAAPAATPRLRRITALRFTFGLDI